VNHKSSKKGWIITKNGKPLNTPDVTKKSLLVGYDMLPLRGLRKAEKDLRTHPYDIRRVVLEYDRKSRLYGASLDGQISLKLAAFSNLHNSIEGTKASTAFALSAYKEYGVSAEECKDLSLFYYLFCLAKDKRQKKRLSNLRLKTGQIFKKLRIVIVPVKYVLVS